jgi:hypothetical protein
MFWIITVVTCHLGTGCSVPLGTVGWVFANQAACERQLEMYPAPSGGPVEFECRPTDTIVLPH